MTKKRTAKLAVLPGLRAWSLISTPHTSKAPTRANSRRNTATQVLIPPHISPHLPPRSLIVPSLPVSHYTVIELSRTFVKMITEQQRPFIPLTLTVTPPLLKQPQDQEGSISDEEEWEIVKIVGKRRTSKGYEYKIRWKKTWLLERELGNAQGLLRKFEVNRQAQQEDVHVRIRAMTVN